ncbi:oxidoreductase C-terminal domain-containing protein [Arthrobacter alpinus]|nr:oxidoreductase C-terminal domain-containing protein [Arthrobacter alpinus]
MNNAIEHAKVAAYSLVGRREDYAGIPWFWSNQADLKLQIAGLSLGYDQTLVRRDDERGKFSVLYYRAGHIIAADCVNTPLDFMAVKNALAKGQNIPADAASDATVPLKSITTTPDLGTLLGASMRNRHSTTQQAAGAPSGPRRTLHPMPRTRGHRPSPPRTRSGPCRPPAPWTRAPLRVRHPLVLLSSGSP